jgi:uncharacterized protein
VNAISSEVVPVGLEDRLPLSCTRLGTCCHGHRIMVSPWEIARLAHGLQVSAARVRDEHTRDGGTCLRADGMLGTQGPAAHRAPACTWYADGHGCRAHGHRPLACRLYPLGRDRPAGTVRYYHLGPEFPCSTLCPSLDTSKRQSFGEYLIEQDTAAAEAAHDGYAAMAYGMVNAALVIADAGVMSRAQVGERFSVLRRLSPDERTTAMGTGWYDLLTIPPVGWTIDASAFVAAHGHVLANMVQRHFSAANVDLALAVEVELLMALHLGSTVGADPQVMGDLVQAPVRALAT